MGCFNLVSLNGSSEIEFRRSLVLSAGGRRLGGTFAQTSLSRLRGVQVISVGFDQRDIKACGGFDPIEE